MQIGDQQISREQMPSFGMTQLNPDHIDQMLQDVITRNLANGGIQMQQPAAPAPNGAEQAAQGQAGGVQ